MTKQQCGNCRYWNRLHDQASDAECRRFPPGLSKGGSVGSSHPLTHFKDWCGEWAKL